MTISISRGATKRLGPISVGSRTTRFKVRGSNRHFIIHEDLICRTSKFFRERLQRKRKPLLIGQDIESCCICFDDLDPVDQDLTFCDTCGHNIHDRCFQRWREASKKQDPENPRETCPICRALWKKSPMKMPIIETNLEPHSVQVYLDWLYSDRLNIPSESKREKEDYPLNLLKCWAVGLAVEDWSFDTVIRNALDEDGVTCEKDTVEWAFGRSMDCEEVKKYLIHHYLDKIDPGWFKKESKKWPTEFVGSLADEALAAMRESEYDY